MSEQHPQPPRANDLEASLLPGEEDALPPERERMKKRTIFCYTLFLTLLLAFGIAFTTLLRNGAFSSIVRDLRIVNGTVVEPNTKLRFALNRETTLENSVSPQRLVGLFLKAKHVPELHASLRVFVMAVYVDRTQARRVLQDYKDGAPDRIKQPEEFAKFVDLASSGQITVTIEYRLLMTPPGGRMYDAWLKDLILLWGSFGADKQRSQALESCFESWFKKSQFKDRDDDMIEFNSRTKQTRVTQNAKLLPLACKDPWFGRAFVMHEFLENGNLITDLLPTLWNKEYDDQVMRE